MIVWLGKREWALASTYRISLVSMIGYSFQTFFTFMPTWTTGVQSGFSNADRGELPWLQVVSKLRTLQQEWERAWARRAAMLTDCQQDTLQWARERARLHSLHNALSCASTVILVLRVMTACSRGDVWTLLHVCMYVCRDLGSQLIVVFTFLDLCR